MATTEQQRKPTAKVPHLTWEERAARGKAARKQVPREQHADFSPGDRPDPVSLLEEQAISRVAELVPIAKRGTAAVACPRSRSIGARP